MTGALVEWVQWSAGEGTALVGAAVGTLALRRRTNATGFVDRLERAGLTPAALEAAVAARPVLAELLWSSLLLAQDTAQERRQDALAALVVAGLDADDHVVDELLVLRRTVERLDDPHMHLLLLIEATPTTPFTDAGGVAGATDEHLATLWPAGARLIVPLRSVLDREGLIRNSWGSSYGEASLPAAWLVSDYGVRLLAHYRAIGGQL